MHLINSLRLAAAPRLALVGAGGKTSVLFHLAREYIENSINRTDKVILTATTHIATDQVQFADNHLSLDRFSEINPLSSRLSEGVTLITGADTKDERTEGLGGKLLDYVLKLGDSQKIPIFIEADGSRMRPLKAPAPHEPVIPPWVDTVVVIAGLSALNEELTDKWVHRPERFARLAGIQLGDVIHPDAVARVLISPDGGLKGIPKGARRVALLNRADTPEREAQGFAMVKELLGAYHSVLLGDISLPLDGRKSSRSNRKFAVADPVKRVCEPVAGVVLAAGASSRLGRPKQLLPWRGEPLVRHVARTAIEAGLSPVLVVTGYASAEVAEALDGLPLNLVRNSDWEAGQGTSVSAGVQTLPGETGAAIFLLSDQPQIPVELLRELVDIHARTLSPIVAPEIEGQRCNPVLFDRITFSDLMALIGDVGGRVLFDRYDISLLTWDDPIISLDVDTEADYKRLLELRP